MLNEQITNELLNEQVILKQYFSLEAYSPNFPLIKIIRKPETHLEYKDFLEGSGQNSGVILDSSPSFKMFVEDTNPFGSFSIISARSRTH